MWLAYEVADRSINPHHQGLDKLFPKLKLKEINTRGQFARALAGGKLTGGGYAPEALAHIATQTKADALHRGIDIVIFTPSPRKGQARAEVHKSVMRLIHALPKFDDTGRFTRISRPLETFPHGNAPDVLPHHVQIMRARKNPLPDVTLRLLQQPRNQRIAQAVLGLKVDGVLSSSQLCRYYGLHPSDLLGRHSTIALIRPIPSRFALEFQQTLVVHDDEMARRDDADLNHRLTLAEMRLSLGSRPIQSVGRLTHAASWSSTSPTRCGSVREEDATPSRRTRASTPHESWNRSSIPSGNRVSLHTVGRRFRRTGDQYLGAVREQIPGGSVHSNVVDRMTVMWSNQHLMADATPRFPLTPNDAASTPNDSPARVRRTHADGPKSITISNKTQASPSVSGCGCISENRAPCPVQKTAILGKTGRS